MSLKNVRPTMVLNIVLILFIGCSKPGSVTITKSPGIFTATVEGANWEPDTYVAEYNPRLHRIIIRASSDYNSLIAGIELDSVAPLKTYLLQPHGDHTAAMTRNTETYYSDQNVADAGGSFQLTKMDLVQNKLSGTLSFTAYSINRTKLVLTSGKIEDIQIKIDTASYDGSTFSCTVNGAVTTTWKPRDLWGYISCISNFKDKTMTIVIPSAAGGPNSRRYIEFGLPLNLRPGTYPILPHRPPYSYCGRLDITCRYIVNNYDNPYHATTGSFTINSIDTTAHTLTASFNVAVKDTSSPAQTISLSNGQIKLNSWYHK